MSELNIVHAYITYNGIHYHIIGRINGMSLPRSSHFNIGTCDIDDGIWEILGYRNAPDDQTDLRKSSTIDDVNLLMSTLKMLEGDLNWGGFNLDELLVRLLGVTINK